MRAKVTKISMHPSKFGGWFNYIFFSDMKGNSFKTCIYPTYRNAKQWKGVIDRFNSGSEVWIDGLVVKGKGLVNADSPFFFYRTDMRSINTNEIS